MANRAALLVLAVVGAALVVVPAFALNIPGTKGNDVLRGTAKADRINGKGGNDPLTGGAGRDVLDGGAGNDKLLIRDKARDTATCGAGRDQVTADAVDVVRASCETVSRPKPLPALGTARENPFPLGRAGDLGNGWTVRVTDVYPDAIAEILAADEFNEPPADGEQFFMIAVSATYDGAEPSSLGSAYSMRAVGASTVEYSPVDNSCGTLPEPNLEGEDPEVEAGTTVAGNAACWSIKSSDERSLVMFYEDLESGTRTWFALR